MTSCGKCDDGFVREPDGYGCVQWTLCDCAISDYQQHRKDLDDMQRDDFIADLINSAGSLL